jgi:hypothetical protein
MILAVFTGHAAPEGGARHVGADVWIQKPHLDLLWPAIRDVRSAARNEGQNAGSTRV